MQKRWLESSLLIIATLVIFVLGIFAAKGINNNLEYLNSNKSIALETLAGEGKVKFLKNGTIAEDNDNLVKEVYQVTKNKVVSSYIYYVMVKGFQPEFHVAINIDIKSKTILGMKYGDYNETYLDKVSSSLLDEFINKDLTNKNFGFSNVEGSGATISSNALVKAANLARLQFYADINEEVPTISFELKDVKQNFNDITKFIAKFEYLGDLFELEFSYDTKFTFISSTKELTEDEKNVCLGLLKLPITYITDISSEGLEKTLTIRTKGYAGTIIGEIVISNAKISSFTIVKENESYDEDYNAGFDKNGTDPITGLPGLLVGAGENVDSVANIAHATVTSKAVKAIYKLALEFIGGNE